MAKGHQSRRRIVGLLLIFGILFSGLIGRMAYLQIHMGDWLAWKGFTYRMRPIPIQPERGELTDRFGQPLVQNVVCESVFAEPLVLKNKPQVAKQLEPLLGISAAELEKRMSRNSFFEWLKRKVSKETAEQVKALGIKGIGFAPEKCRNYPEGDLAVHALGITNLDHHGIEGLELTYDKHLMGKPSYIQCEYTARGLPMPDGECRIIEGKPGLTLMTTIDSGLQRLAEKNVERAILETNADRATIIIMDVKTGEILSLAQWPKFDPKLGGNSDPKLRRIYTVADTLPPGSIFKPVTAAAALDAGLITANSRIQDTGCFEEGGWTICNWDHKALGSVTIREVMANSSNVGFGKLGRDLGRENFYKYHAAFGFNKPTGIDLPGEAVGQWIPKKLATPLDLAIQGFGQTLTVSPIQMLTAVAAIANDGKRMWPHLGKALLDADGNIVQEIEPRVVEQAVPEEVARLVQELMVEVVEVGTGKNARVAGYKVGGKTGTATKVIDGKVAKGHYIASFVGFAPFPDPEVAVLISVDEPKGVYYGGQIAAPIFGEVMADVLAYLETPQRTDTPPPPAPGAPPPPRAPEQVTAPLLVNLPVAEAERAAKAAGFQAQFIGSGATVTSQLPLPGATAYKGSKIYVYTDLPAPSGEMVRVPNLVGVSLTDAARALANKDLIMLPEGAGQVTHQSPAPGTLAPKGSVVRVKLAPPSRSP